MRLVASIFLAGLLAGCALLPRPEAAEEVFGAATGPSVPLEWEWAR